MKATKSVDLLVYQDVLMDTISVMESVPHVTQLVPLVRVPLFVSRVVVSYS